MTLKEQIDKNKLPQHIAVIMDGNGRWAKKQGLIRTKGHEQGENSVRETVEICRELGVKNLTIFAFSTENWNRPKYEVNTLMKLLVKSLKKEIDSFHKNDIRLNAIGNLDLLPEKPKKELLEAIKDTANNKHMTLTVALSYGSREEIVSAVKKISEKVKMGEIDTNQITEKTIDEHLYTSDLPDVDLLIRTSGEERISNFLLWQIAYAELYFTEVLWPDFTQEDLIKAVINYQNRERRFGKTSEQIN